MTIDSACDKVAGPNGPTVLLFHVKEAMSSALPIWSTCWSTITLPSTIHIASKDINNCYTHTPDLILQVFENHEWSLKTLGSRYKGLLIVLSLRRA